MWKRAGRYWKGNESLAGKVILLFWSARGLSIHEEKEYRESKEGMNEKEQKRHADK